MGPQHPDVVPAWVAFTQTTEANEAMEYVPGSHKLDQIPHRDTFAKHNLLTRGQEVMVEVDYSRRRIITLRPGEMSLHHVRLVHGSPPNPSNDRRIGFAIRYIPTMVAQLAGQDSASLVRGEDRHHHFMAEPQPSRDLDPEFVALHHTITERNARILYRETFAKHNLWTGGQEETVGVRRKSAPLWMRPLRQERLSPMSPSTKSTGGARRYAAPTVVSPKW